MVSTRRYAHSKCWEKEKEKLAKQEKDRLELEAYIAKIFGEDFVNPRIRKQINVYIEDYHYTYSGILKALIYFTEVKGNNISQKASGIGIVPYIYKEAFDYYYSIWLSQEKNKNFDASKYKVKVKEVKIPRPQRKIRKKSFFNFLDEEKLDE